jgi:hypothetical protein
MEGKRADEHAAEKPHRPRPAADAGGTALSREVDDLGQIGEHRDRDSGHAEKLKQRHTGSPRVD